MISWLGLKDYPGTTDIVLIQELLYSMNENNALLNIMQIFSRYKNIYLDYLLSAINHFITPKNSNLYVPIIDKLIEIHGKDIIQLWCYLSKSDISDQMIQLIPGLNGKNRRCCSTKIKFLEDFFEDDISKIACCTNQSPIYLAQINSFSKNTFDILWKYQGKEKLSNIEIACLLGKNKCFHYFEANGGINDSNKDKLFHYAIVGGGLDIIQILIQKYHVIPKLIDLKLSIYQKDTVLFMFLYENLKLYLCEEDLKQIILWCFMQDFLNGIEIIGEFNSDYLLEASIKTNYSIFTNIVLDMKGSNPRFSSDMIILIIKNATKGIFSLKELIDKNQSIIQEINKYIIVPNCVLSIPNIGNSCFMAVNIQMFINSDSFAQLVRKMITSGEIDSLTLLFLDIYLNHWIKGTNTVDLHPFYYIFKDYELGKMYDTHEFFADFFSYISKHYYGLPDEIFYLKKTESRGYEYFTVAYPFENNPIQKTTTGIVESHDVFSILFQRMAPNRTQTYNPIDIPEQILINDKTYSIYSIVETFRNHCVVYFTRNHKFFYASDSLIREISKSYFSEITRRNIKTNVVLYTKVNEIYTNSETISEDIPSVAPSFNEELNSPDSVLSESHCKSDNIKKFNLYLWQIEFSMNITINTEIICFNDLSDFIVTHVFNDNKMLERLIEYDLIYKDKSMRKNKIDKNSKLASFQNEILENRILVYFKNVKKGSESFEIMERHCQCLSESCNCRFCDQKILISDILNHEIECKYFNQHEEIPHEKDIMKEEQERVKSDETIDYGYLPPLDLKEQTKFRGHEVINYDSSDDPVLCSDSDTPSKTEKEKLIYEELLNINLIELNHILENQEATYTFLRKIEHIKETRQCPKCGHKMHIEKDNSSYLKHRYRCYKCQKSLSLLADSIYFKSKLTPREFILIIYMFSSYYSRNKTAQESRVNLSTITDIFTLLRKACETYLMDSELEPIGGADHIVEIDETLVSRKKYHKGREVKENWIFGGIDRTTNELFAFLVENRKADTLLDVIKQCILPGTTIMSDEWASYRKLHTDIELSKLYKHSTINHKKYFVDPNDRSINTQKIERLWRSIKRFKEQGVPRDKEQGVPLLRQKYKLNEKNSFAWFMTYLIPQINFY